MASSQARSQPKGGGGERRKRVLIKEDIADDADFDVVEESPDEATSDEGTTASSEGEGDDGNLLTVKKDKKKRRVSAGKLVFGLKEGSKEMNERLRLIRQQSVHFADFLGALDYDMLRRFAFAMIGFFSLSVFIFCVFLFVLFMADAKLWHVYFPPIANPADFEIEEQQRQEL